MENDETDLTTSHENYAESWKKNFVTDNKCVIVADSSSNEEGDLMNYKGIYFNDDPNSKFTCPETGAHFQFRDMCQRL